MVFWFFAGTGSAGLGGRKQTAAAGTGVDFAKDIVVLGAVVGTGDAGTSSQSSNNDSWSSAGVSASKTQHSSDSTDTP